MSTTIDQQVLEMRFDNKNFESGVSSTLSSIEKLKQKLNFKGASKGFEELDSAAKKVDMSSIGNAVEKVKERFSALEVMAVTALVNITNSAVNAGKKIISALTIDPIKTGFQEYETKMGSIQTIMANTGLEGKKGMSKVTGVLDELNTYADKTIYNFAEMTRNIGTFTAAGVDLDTSATAIQGIANLAAVSGSTSQQASTAMYQLSQALSSGTVKLMDWNSVVNAGMGGKVFQEALKKTAREHGVAVDAMIKKSGSFRESLQEGWITADVLTETLNKMTRSGAAEYVSKTAKVSLESAQELQKLGETAGYDSEEFKKMALEISGGNKEMAENVTQTLKAATTAENAATKVKTLTQLWDTLKESAQSGWSQSWEIIVGDFEEAKELFTEISDTVGALIGKSADARNKVLQGWKDLGGRTAIVDALRNTFQGVLSIVQPITKAFREVFPPVTAKQLVKFSESLRDLTSHLKLTDKQATKLHDVVKNFLQPIRAVVDIVKIAGKFIFNLAKNVIRLGSPLLLLVTGASKVAGKFKSLSDVIKKLDGFVTKLTTSMDGLVDSALKKFQNFARWVNTVFESIRAGFSSFKKSISLFVNFGKVFDTVGNAAQKLGETIRKVLTFDNLEKGGKLGLGALFGGYLVSAIKGVSTLVGKLGDTLDDIGSGKAGAFGKIANAFDALTDSLKAMQKDIQSKTILRIAEAVGILAASIVVLSLIEPSRLAIATGAITALLGEMIGSLALLNKVDYKGSTKAVGTIIGLAAAMLILAFAMKIIASMSPQETVQALLAVGVALGEFAFMIDKANFNKVSKDSGKGMMEISVALVILAAACKIFATMEWNELGKAGAAIGALLLAFAGFSHLISEKDMKRMASGLLILSVAMVAFAGAAKLFATMEWNEFGKAGAAIGALLLAFAGFSHLISEKEMVRMASGLLILGVAGLAFAGAAKIFATMEWNELGKAGAAIGALLLAFAGFSHLVKPAQIMTTAAAMVVMAGAILLFSIAIKALGSMPFAQIIQGIGAIALTFAVLGASAAILGPLVPTMLGLAGALLAVGAAIALAGAGVLAFGLGLTALAAGITALAVAGPVAIQGLIAMVKDLITGIIGLIPDIVVAIGEGLKQIIKMLTALTPSIIKLATTLVSKLLEMIRKLAPEIVDTIKVLVTQVLAMIQELAPQLGETLLVLLRTALMVLEGAAYSISETLLFLLNTALDALTSFIPQLADKGMEMLSQFLWAIASRVGDVIIAATAIILAFLYGIGQSIQIIIQAGWDLIIGFINGLTNSIEQNTPILCDALNRLFTVALNAAKQIIITMITPFKNAGSKLAGGVVNKIKEKVKDIWNHFKSALTTAVNGIKDFVGRFRDAGKAIIDGAIGGIKKAASKIVDIVLAPFNKAIKAVKKLLGIGSPSKLFYKFGKWTDEGFINGIKILASHVIGSVKNLGDGAVSAMRNAMEKVNDFVESDINAQPVISPVMDLSNVSNGIGNLNSMFNDSHILSAQSGVESYRMAKAVSAGYGANAVAGKIINNNFTQNNYSPEPLSRLDIYKDTNTMMSKLEKAGRQ